MISQALFLLMGVTSTSSWAVDIECPISLPERGNIPERLKDYERGDYISRWVGTKALAARVPDRGYWTGMGSKSQFGDKWWWWREGYSARDETNPDLKITGRRLDGGQEVLEQPFVTNAMGPGWDMILVGMNFPAAGCWEVNARYRNESLRFVFEVGDKVTVPPR